MPIHGSQSLVVIFTIFTTSPGYRRELWVYELCTEKSVFKVGKNHAAALDVLE